MVFNEDIAALEMRVASLEARWTKRFPKINTEPRKCDVSIVRMLDAAIRATCDVFNIKEEALIGKLRTNDICKARFAYYSVANIVLGCPQERVAERCGFRNHGSVSSGIQACNAIMAIDASYRMKVRSLADLLEEQTK